jgi:hypothetical protein
MFVVICIRSSKKFTCILFSIQEIRFLFNKYFANWCRKGYAIILPTGTLCRQKFEVKKSRFIDSMVSRVFQDEGVIMIELSYIKDANVK